MRNEDLKNHFLRFIDVSMKEIQLTQDKIALVDDEDFCGKLNFPE